MVQTQSSGTTPGVLSDDGITLAEAADTGADFTGHPPEAVSPAMRIVYALGGAGLLLATASDALAVAGRHLGFRILGSIEIVQSAVVLLASSAMLIATVVGGHASVHLVTERLGPAARELARRISAAISALVFLALAAGSIWVASDLWNGFEETELIHIPLRWLRLLWIVFAILVAGAFARSALVRKA